MLIRASKCRQQNSFQGLHTAKITGNLNNIKTNIDIFRIDKHDKNFLKLLCKDINMENRMPGLTKYEYERWHEMLELAVDEASKESNTSYIASVNDRACGIISFNEGRKKFHLHCICTWPVEFGEKVKFAGKSLFYQMFKNFADQNSGKIELEAITNGPYDTVNKYKKLGFKEITSEGHKVLMETNKYEVKNTLNNLKRMLNYIPAQNPVEIRLIDTLEI